MATRKGQRSRNESYSDDNSSDNPSEDEDDFEEGSDDGSEESDSESPEKTFGSSDFKDLPLFERLKAIEERDEKDSFSNSDSSRIKKLKRHKNLEGNTQAKFTHKNAPALMMSNKPVRRLRVTGNNSVRKARDPRFSDVSGKLNQDKFNLAYGFLDKYQSDEVDVLTKAIKKTKSSEKREIYQSELSTKKQQLLEHRRAQNLKERLSKVRAEEKSKVAQGKKPFFLKESARKTIALEERFDELKKEGKLQKFLEKKRKRNASKDHRYLPSRRQKLEEE